MHTFANRVCDWYLHWDTKKYEKNEKSRTWPIKKAITALVTFIENSWPRFVFARNVCWSRFRPCSTRPVHGPQRNRVPWPHYNMANKPFGHVRGHVSGHVSLYSWSRLATFRSCSWPRFVHARGHVAFIFVVTFTTFWPGSKQNFWSFFARFLRGFWNRSNATNICIWDHSKGLENQFLGTFKSCQAVENNFIFIFMNFLFLAKTGLENGHYRSQKGLKSEFSSLLDP